MLTREIMGGLALAILWVNTLLIVAAGAKELFALGERRARLKPRAAGDSGPGFGLLKGRVVEGNDGAVARHRIDQVGRSAGHRETKREIIFADRKAESEVLGGSIALDGGGEAVIMPGAQKTSAAEVWVAETALREAAECRSDEDFDAAFAEAKKARGFLRSIEVAIRPGEEVWVAGEISRRGSDAAVSVAPSKRFGLLISTVDPRRLLAKKIGLSIAALAAILGGAAGVTILALTPPSFGLISMLGGALGLGFFLIAQPAGTALHEAVLLPHRAFVRGAWTRAAADPRRERRSPRAASTAPKAGHAPPPPAA